MSGANAPENGELSANREVLKRIDDMLHERGWSRRELAAAAHLNENMVGAWYKRLKDGEAPAIKAQDAYAIAQALQVTVEYLLTGENPTLPERSYESAEQAQLIDWIRGLSRDEVMKLWAMAAMSVQTLGLPAMRSATEAKKEKTSGAA